MSAPTLEIDIDPVWGAMSGHAADWEALAARAAGAAAAVAPELASDTLLVSLVFADNAEVQALNQQWRAKDMPTNVLSFPMLSRAAVLKAAAGPQHAEMLGDIILAHGICVAEAAEKGVSVQAHATHLIVHGLLHLAGHDHETGADDAAQMEVLETKALAMLGLADPYGGS